MEGPGKFTPEQIADNKTREKEATRIVTEDGGIHINDRGEAEIVASEKEKKEARRDMNWEQANSEFYEKYKDMVGKNVRVEFVENLDSAVLGTDFLPTGMGALNPFSFFGKRNEKNIDVTLKDISGDLMTVEFEGKELELHRPSIKGVRPMDEV